MLAMPVRFHHAACAAHGWIGGVEFAVIGQGLFSGRVAVLREPLRKRDLHSCFLHFVVGNRAKRPRRLLRLTGPELPQALLVEECQ